jgi:hypoxanthine phosphoribosyltransferase
LSKQIKRNLLKNNIVGKVLFSSEDIQKKVIELGNKITEDYVGKDLLLISVLRGGIIFLSDLARHIDLEIYLDIMSISTYGIGESSTGVVRITKDLEEPIEGKDVLIVEDIIDTGLTISYLMRTLKARYPKSLEICTLLDRNVRRITDIEIKYVGFNIGENYIVGYGLDYKQKFRNLNAIHELKIDTVKKDIESIKNSSIF